MGGKNTLVLLIHTCNIPVIIVNKICQAIQSIYIHNNMTPQKTRIHKSNENTFILVVPYITYRTSFIPQTIFLDEKHDKVSILNFCFDFQLWMFTISIKLGDYNSLLQNMSISAITPVIPLHIRILNALVLES